MIAVSTAACLTLRQPAKRPVSGAEEEAAIFKAEAERLADARREGPGSRMVATLMASISVQRKWLSVSRAGGDLSATHPRQA